VSGSRGREARPQQVPAEAPPCVTQADDGCAALSLDWDTGSDDVGTGCGVDVAGTGVVSVSDDEGGVVGGDGDGVLEGVGSAGMFDALGAAALDEDALEVLEAGAGSGGGPSGLEPVLDPPCELTGAGGTIDDADPGAVVGADCALDSDAGHPPHGADPVGPAGGAGGQSHT
jgi:hypothetical protein